MGKRARDDVQYAHAKLQEGYVIVFNTTVELGNIARDEVGCELVVHLGTVLLVHECTPVSKTLLHRRDSIKEPCGVDEGGFYLRLLGTEEIEENEVLYRTKLRLGGREESPLRVGLDVAGRPFLCKMSAQVNA